MEHRPRLTFFLDVDNTLLNNDAAKAEMHRRLEGLLGAAGAARFWEIYEEIREAETVVDIPTTIDRFLGRAPEAGPRFELAALFMEFPFEDFVHPDALAVIRRLGEFGQTAILSDGDSIFQVNKIHRAGLAAAVDGRVIVYPHKERHLPELMAAFPADRYVVVDDKAEILCRIAESIGAPCSTVFVRQGKYGHVPPPEGFIPTLSVAALADLLTISNWPATS